MKLFAEEGYQILVLHDLDVNGFGILANIQDGNHRVAGVDCEVLDLGLRLDEIPDLDRRVRELSGAHFDGGDATRQKKLPDTILKYLTSEELALLTGTQRNKKVWDYTRYELNEIPAALRVPFVERKREAAGVRRKVIPPASYLGDTADSLAESDIEYEADKAIDELLADTIKADIVERFKGRYDLDLLEAVRRGLEADPQFSWRSVLRRKIRVQGRELRGEIEAAIREYLPDDDGETDNEEDDE